jgi:RNA polymerase sigma-70 factor (ECF subfamily)
VTERREGEADDAALVRAVAHGSEEALGTLYDRHVRGVHAVALRMTGDREVAEEVVQDTFLALWNRAETFDPAIASLGTWLRSIARNRAVDRARATGRRPVLVSFTGGADPDSMDDGLDRIGPGVTVLGGAASDQGPEATAESAAAIAAVEEALAAMPDVERAVIVLAYRDQLTQQEIADRLGWPLGTVKTRTRRALGRLRVVLEGDEAAAQAGSALHGDVHGTR